MRPTPSLVINKQYIMTYAKRSILNRLAIPRPRIECLEFFKFLWGGIIRDVKTYRQTPFQPILRYAFHFAVEFGCPEVIRLFDVFALGHNEIPLFFICDLSET